MSTQDPARKGMSLLCALVALSVVVMAAPVQDRQRPDLQAWLDRAGASPAFVQLTQTPAGNVAFAGEPRCGKDYANVQCSGVGKKGMCCSKWGFCGKKPFHCLTRLGCQGECNNDMDVKLDEDDHPEPPVPVIRTPREPMTKIIIKTITPSVPLCENCPPKANITILNITLANAPSNFSASSKLLNGIAGGVPSIDLSADKPSKNPAAVFDYRAAIRDLRRIQAEAVKFASETIDNARKKAQKMVDPNAAAFPIGGDGSALNLKIDVLGRNQLKVTPSALPQPASSELSELSSTTESTQGIPTSVATTAFENSASEASEASAKVYGDSSKGKKKA